ncbi:hypothetical protein D3C73_1016000 [compost metagenome]
MFSGSHFDRLATPIPIALNAIANAVFISVIQLGVMLLYLRFQNPVNGAQPDSYQHKNECGQLYPFGHAHALGLLSLWI